MAVRAVRFNPNPTCAVCGAAPRIHALDAADYVDTVCRPADIAGESAQH